MTQVFVSSFSLFLHIVAVFAGIALGGTIVIVTAGFLKGWAGK